MIHVKMPLISQEQYDLLIETLFNTSQTLNKNRLDLIKKLETETIQCVGSQSIKDRLITKILDNYEADQVLIDILRLDLHGLAENELNKLDETRLLDIVLEN